MKTNGTESVDGSDDNGSTAAKKKKLGDDDYGVESVGCAFDFVIFMVIVRT